VRRGLLLAVALVLSAPAGAETPVGEATPECQSCNARHAAMQELQAARAAQRCAEAEAEPGSAPAEDCVKVQTTDALLPPPPAGD
jgi:hypothetical protein